MGLDFAGPLLSLVWWDRRPFFPLPSFSFFFW
jgi:hypothetical protein